MTSKRFKKLLMSGRGIVLLSKSGLRVGIVVSRDEAEGVVKQIKDLHGRASYQTCFNFYSNGKGINVKNND